MNLNKMHLKTLLLLAENEAYVKSVKFTTPTLAQMLGTSQQSASRILIKMENEGLIERRIVGRLSY
ncbi:MAG: helix-turn-helix domain-containing protein, partial [Nitrososphaerota archaeon]